jgi:hypothetical protein
MHNQIEHISFLVVFQHVLHRLVDQNVEDL